LAPQNPVEEAIANMWKDLFGFDEIGVQDDFLELGGDSLKSITVLSRMHQEFHVAVPLSEFFGRSTIKELAEYILDNKEKSSYEMIEPVEKKDFYTVSSAQRRLYILGQTDLENISYNLPHTVVLRGKPGKNRLDAAFKKLIQRHESLKASFVMVEGEPVQKINREVEYAIEYIDAKAGKEGITTGKETETIINNFVKPFNLAQPPLMKMGFIELDEYNLLIVDIHHIISDAFTLVLLEREFMALYAGKDLPSLKLQYRDYSEWLNSKAVKKKRSKQAEYWVKEFEGEIPLLNLPIDYPRPSVRSYEGNRINFKLGTQETRILKKMARQENATLYMVLLSLFNVLLSKLSGQEDIVLGLGTAGRGKKELQNIVGMFVNTLALRNYPAGDKTFKVFLREVKERTLKALDNQDYMFEDLVERVVPKRDMSRNPIFDVMFAYNTIDMDPIVDTDIDIRGSDIKTGQVPISSYDTKHSQFDLSIISSETNDILSFMIEYCVKLFKEDTIKRFFGYFKEIMSYVVENENIKLEDIAISHDLLKAKISRSQEDIEGFQF
jgi:acyl carrier protein